MDKKHYLCIWIVAKWVIELLIWPGNKIQKSSFGAFFSKYSSDFWGDNLSAGLKGDKIYCSKIEGTLRSLPDGKVDQQYYFNQVIPLIFLIEKNGFLQVFVSSGVEMVKIFNFLGIKLSKKRDRLPRVILSR